MSLRLRESEPLDTALRRLALDCVDQALAALDGADGRDVAIHQIRKQCKQFRSLLRLYRSGLEDGFRHEARFFRDLSRSLAAARDAAVALDMHAALVEQYGAIINSSVSARIRQLLIADFHAVTAPTGRTSRRPPDNDTLRAQLLAARSRCRQLRLARADRILERGLLAGYRQGRKAARRAQKTRDERDLHALRKYAKNYWHQLEFVARRWPDLALQRQGPVHRLTVLLGDLQDTVVYRHAIERVAAGQEPEGVEILAALVDQRRRGLEVEALDLAQLIFAERPRQLRAELQRHDVLRRVSR